MNKRELRFFLCICLAVALFVSGSFAQILDKVKVSQDKWVENSAALKEVDRWFSAWEFVSGEIFGVSTFKPVEFVFFDAENIYSTSNISVPNGKFIDGPKLFGKKLIWRRDNHNGKIMLPDGQVVPIGLMSFAAPLNKRNKKAFFVMPLHEFWEKAGVKSEELGFEKLLTGIFLHEFSHSQQMETFGKKVSEFEKKNKFDGELSDDIIQDYFEKNSAYESAFREEIELFYKAADVDEKPRFFDLIKRSMNTLKTRQNKYFVADKKHFKEIDDFFLTMEGFGQMTMYLWLINPKSGNMSPELALKGVRRGGKFWSQDQGLALFLVLNKFSKPKNWSKKMLGGKTETVVKLLENEIKNTSKKTT